MQSDFVRSPLFCANHPREVSEDSKPPCSIAIDGTETRMDTQANKPYTVFTVEAKTCCNSWIVYRRYSDFVKLYTDLEKDLPGVRLPKLPPKKLFVCIYLSIYLYMWVWVGVGVGGLVCVCLSLFLSSLYLPISSSNSLSLSLSLSPSPASLSTALLPR